VVIVTLFIRFCI